MRAYRVTTVFGILAGVLLLMTTAFGTAGAQTFEPPFQLRTSLSGAEEVGPMGELGVGDPDGSGAATIIVIPSQDRICFVLTARDIEPAAAAHIHEGAAGTNGPVVVNLTPPTRGASGGCVSGAGVSDVIDGLIEDPSDYYVNVHNGPFPAGAIRGHL